MIKLRIPFIFIFLFLCYLGCRNSPQLITNTTYFAENFPNGGVEYSYLASEIVNSAVSITGVYRPKKIGRYELPVIYSFTAEGIGYTFLADSLNIDTNTFVRVEGEIETTTLTFGFKKSGYQQKVLNIARWLELDQTNHFIENTQKKFGSLRSELEKSIQPHESKLILPAKPAWHLLINEKEQHAIVSSNSADLMYQLDINFVYGLQDEKLIKIYCYRWFKGE